MYKIQMFKAKLVKERIVSYPVQRLMSADDVALLAHHILKDQPFESVLCFWLNGAQELIGVQEIARGGVHGCALTPRDVFLGACARGVSAIILAHNHPSGDATPSSEDIAMTRIVRDAGHILGIPLVDHVIVTSVQGRAASLADMGIV